MDTCYKKFEEYRKNGCWTYFYEMDHLFTLYKYEEGLLKLPETGNGQHIRYGCSCGKKLKKLRVLPDGTVMACRRVKDSILGNIMTDSLETLLLQKKCYSDVSLYEGCSKCILAPYCRGCPGVASGQTGNFFARDPQCWHNDIVP